MVSTETLQVVLNAKDNLSSAVQKVNNTLKQTGSVASSSSNTATQSTNRITQAYTQLQSKITGVFNNIRNTITNSATGQAISSSGLAKPFLNSAETIKQRWSSMAEQIKGKLKSSIGNQVITIKGDNGDVIKKITVTRQELEKIKRTNADPFQNISTAGLQTLNGQLNQATVSASKFQGTAIQTGNSVKTITTSFGGLGGIASGVMAKISTAFATAQTKVTGFTTKLQGIGSKMMSITAGLSGVQSAIMGAFGAVGVTSISQFTLGSAIARQKINAVTTSITGSQAATNSLNKAISNATKGGVVGFNNVAKSVQQIGIKYNLSNKQLEETAPLLNKIGTLSRVMGKDANTTATIMSRAYDGLNGNFRLLQLNLGISKDQLLAEGWSGAASDVDGYTKALQKVLDKMPEMQEYYNSYEGQMERLKMAVAGVGRQIGEVFLPILKAILGAFLNLNEKCPWLTTALVVVGVVILGVVSALSALAPVILMVAELWTAEATANLIALAPYIAIAAAVLVLVGVLWHLYNTNDKVKQVMDAVAKTVKGTLTKAWDNLNKIVQPIVPTFQHLFSVIGRAVNDFLQFIGVTDGTGESLDTLSGIVKLLGIVFEAIVNTMVTYIQILASILVPVLNFIVNVIANLISFITTLAEAFSLLMSGDIVGFFTTIGGALQTFIVDTVTNFGQMFLEIFNNLNVTFEGALTAVWSWITTMVNAFVTGAWSMVTGFISWICQLPGMFWNWLQVAWSNLQTWSSNIYNKAVSTGKELVDGFISFITSLPSRFWTWLQNTIAKANSFKDTIKERMRNAAQGAVDGFKSKITNLPNLMAQELQNIVNKIRNGAGNIYQAMKNLASNMVAKFKEKLGIGSPGYMAWMTFDETGYIADKLRRGTDNVRNATESLANTIVDTFYGNGAGTLETVYKNANFDGLNSLNNKKLNIETVYKNANLDMLNSLNNEKLNYAVNFSNDLKELQTEKQEKIDNIIKLLEELVNKEAIIQNDTNQNKNNTNENNTIQNDTTENNTIHNDTTENNIIVLNLQNMDRTDILSELKKHISNKEVLSLIANNSDFQRFDQRKKNKILGEYARHI